MQFKNKYWLPASFLSFLIVYSYVVSTYFYFVNPDAISYLAVSEHIIDGNLKSALNGYWSPLISWLLVPFLLFIKDGFVCFWIVNGLLGLLIIYLVYKITHLITKVVGWVNSIFIAISILVAAMCFLQLTADILFVTILLWYTYLLLNNKIYSSFVQLAIMGVLLFLSKAYGFYFFMVFQIFHFGIYFKKLSSFQKNNFYKGFSLFLFLSSIWMGLLSFKYNTLTISTAGIYNSKIIKSNGALLHPCDTMKMIEPQFGATYSAWEEMYLHTKHVKTHHNETNFGKRIFDNIFNTVKVYNHTTRYGAFICIALLIGVSFLQFKIVKKISTLILLLLIFSGGYLAFFINERYLYFGILLMVVLNFYFINFLTTRVKWIGIFLVCLIHYSILKSVYHSVVDVSKNEERICFEINKHFPKKGIRNYASYYAYQFPLLSYPHKWKDFGGTQGYQNDSISLLNDLTKYQIDCLLYPDSIKLPVNIKVVYPQQKLPGSVKGIAIYCRQPH